jgi:hypothetical protein
MPTPERLEFDLTEYILSELSSRGLSVAPDAERQLRKRLETASARARIDIADGSRSVSEARDSAGAVVQALIGRGELRRATITLGEVSALTWPNIWPFT